MSTSSRAPGIVSKFLATFVLFSLTAPSVADDAGRAWSASIGAGSDYTFRGVSQTMGDPAIQASFDVSFSSGLYAYAWGSNVDFVPNGQPDDGATHEIDLAIGYAAEVTDDWSVDLSIVRYIFPGTVNSVDYDYNELMATVLYGGKYSATVAYSGNVDGTGADSVLYRLGASFGLPADTTLDICYGYYDLSNAYENAYSYSRAALARGIGNTEISLAYTDTSHSAESIFDAQVTGPRLVLSLRIDW